MSFEPVAASYDEQVGRLQTWQREQVWRYLDKYFQPGMRVLEIGSGTGTDAFHLVQRGITVHITDPAPTMIRLALTKTKPYAHLVTSSILPAENLHELTETFDGAFANFSPLNAVADIASVARTLGQCLAPGAPLLLVMFGRYCLWEMAGYLLKGKPHKAFRRWQSGEVAVAVCATNTAPTYFHTSQTLKAAFAPWFQPIATVGIGVCVPPAHLNWEPTWLPVAQQLDISLGATFPYNQWGDHQLFIWRRR
jgi:ubiquinone/menaquinone biosynthesis C-methylase UbiE